MYLWYLDRIGWDGRMSNKCLLRFAPENRPSQNVVSQPSIFRGYVSFRWCMIWDLLFVQGDFWLATMGFITINPPFGRMFSFIFSDHPTSKSKTRIPVVPLATFFLGLSWMPHPFREIREEFKLLPLDPLRSEKSDGEKVIKHHFWKKRLILNEGFYLWMGSIKMTGKRKLRRKRNRWIFLVAWKMLHFHRGILSSKG